ncbi:hypothetical protein [Actinomadura sediminis]|uniref:Uncharacterized protein n=1 Tax=Actinomadura sediminis TaxID=1038904 RepID=A0ABW3ELW0_9ACTN
MPKQRNAAVLAVTVAALAVTAAVAPAASARPDKKEPKVASVTGWGEMRRTYHQDQDVRAFAFDARATPYANAEGDFPGAPNAATGTVRISHHSPDLNKTITASGRVDSLTTAPGYAVLTAVIDEVDEGGPDWVGRRLGFSVYDGGKDKPGRTRDRVGYGWEFMNLTQNENGEWAENLHTGTGMAPAPFGPVTRGGFTVVHTDLPPVPGS